MKIEVRVRNTGTGEVIPVDKCKWVGRVSSGFLRAFDKQLCSPVRCTLEWKTGYRDKLLTDIYENDRVRYRGKIGRVLLGSREEWMVHFGHAAERRLGDIGEKCVVVYEEKETEIC